MQLLRMGAIRKKEAHSLALDFNEQRKDIVGAGGYFDEGAGW